ncbi:hypothetical protein C8F01DRAFT_45871 [Mycena amicta]|nr:hypothetical protein C8F01DRAFT_45871 [Mycena amicta]
MSFAISRPTSTRAASPSTIDHRPSTIDHRPSTIDHRAGRLVSVTIYPPPSIPFASISPRPAPRHTESLRCRYMTRWMIIRWYTADTVVIEWDADGAGTASTGVSPSSDLALAKAVYAPRRVIFDLHSPSPHHIHISTAVLLPPGLLHIGSCVSPDLLFTRLSVPVACPHAPIMAAASAAIVSPKPTYREPSSSSASSSSS